ncbi:hypothetical protein [Streptacidiphilus anmyonensis]|uniref:hypothetical protein n=1 Tax=Streptacidiphilus anmyonensis TaxID=405782 RepID=UPI0005A8C46A|nr:hypothetical protein [Streptacidiphilus anmyonensis]
MIRNGKARWFSAVAASVTVALSLGAAPAQARGSHPHDTYVQIRIVGHGSDARCLSNYLGLHSQHLDLLPCSLGTELLLWKTPESGKGTTELRPDWNPSWCLRPGRPGTDQLGWTGACGVPSTKWRISRDHVMNVLGGCIGIVGMDQAGLVPCRDKDHGGPAYHWTTVEVQVPTR